MTHLLGHKEDGTDGGFLALSECDGSLLESILLLGEVKILQHMEQYQGRQVCCCCDLF
jgi:hypothetical protein